MSRLGLGDNILPSELGVAVLLGESTSLVPLILVAKSCPSQRQTS